MLSTLRRGAILTIRNSFIENNTEQIEVPEITELLDNSPPDIAIEIKNKYNEKEHLDKYKHNELRDALKYYKSTVDFHKNSAISHRKYSSADQKKIKANFDFILSGKKKDIIHRIVDFLKKENACKQMQKLFRGKMTRDSIQLRGDGLKNRSLCVNETDFYTFDKLTNIEASDFFSYKCGDFIYGFRLSSIISLFKSKTKNILNPYTRTKMEFLIVPIERLSKLTKIIHKEVPEEINEFVNNKITIRSGPARTVYTRNALQNIRTQENGYNYTETINKLNQIREQTMEARIMQLFMEIDQLGNYTESGWFSNLDTNQYIRYYRILYEIWSYRSRLPLETKNKICPFGSPFMLNTINSTDEANMKSSCVYVMENMIYTGITADFKTLGAFQVLTALTIVSPQARTSMPWLYESIV